jgi:hypothetical protein
VRGGAVRFFLSLNGYGIPAPGQGAGFYAETAAPVLIYFVDHPAHHHPTVRAPLPHLAVTFATESEAAFCRAHVRSDIPVRALAHAAAASTEAPPAWETRDVPLLFSASLHAEPEALRAGWCQHGAAVERSLNDVVAAHDAAPARPLGETVLDVIGRDDRPIAILASYIAAADLYIRNRQRRALVTTLAHLPLLVCGKGWESLAAESAVPGKAARFLAAQPAPAAAALMRRAKLVLNPMPAYYDSHERPFQAMAAGAVAATGPSNLFGVAEFAGALLSLPAAPRNAAARIEAALADEDALQSVAAAGTRVQAAAHRWDDRARSLIAMAGGFEA